MGRVQTESPTCHVRGLKRDLREQKPRGSWHELNQSSCIGEITEGLKSHLDVI